VRRVKGFLLEHRASGGWHIPLSTPKVRLEAVNVVGNVVGRWPVAIQAQAGVTM